MEVLAQHAWYDLQRSPPCSGCPLWFCPTSLPIMNGSCASMLECMCSIPNSLRYLFIFFTLSHTYRDKYLTKPLNKVVLCAVLEELAAERDGGRRSNSVTEGRSTSLAHSPTSPPSLQAARLEQVERVLSVFVPKEFQVRSRNFFPYWPSLSSPPFSFKYRNW